MPTHELIQGCKNNDRKAQMALYSKYCDGMFAVAMRYVKSAETAEDVLQDAFVKAFQNLKQFEGAVSFGAWLKRIVINQCLDVLKVRQLDFVTIAEEALVRSEETPWEVSDDCSLEEIKKAVDKLPENYRTVVQLFLIEGYDHEEIASVLKISTSGSRSLLCRAKKSLVTQLNPVADGTRS